LSQKVFALSRVVDQPRIAIAAHPAMYFLRRMLFLIPLLLFISLLAFLLVRLAPGGPFDRDRKPASPEIERNLRIKYHLDESIPRQYLRFLGGLLHGDFGPSLKYRNHGVSDIILQGLPVSAVLGLLAFGFATGVGVPLGFIGAIRKGRWQGHTSSFLAILGVCVPGFIIGPLLVMGLAIHWRWFPVALWESPAHAILPTIALGLFFAGKVARLMREGVLANLDAEFVTTARAKGLTEIQVMLRHVLRMAILPVVSYLGPMLADLLTGSFVVENLFQIPGIGVFLVNSSLNRDYPMVVGLVLVYATLLLGLNLAVDLTYSLLDRRIKLG
jgi:oligopeptide transport system permease protein